MNAKIKSQQRNTEPRFKCDICGAESVSKQYIMHHMRRNHSSNRIICVYCEQDFNTEYEKKLHLFTSHVDKYLISCEICDERFELFSIQIIH